MRYSERVLADYTSLKTGGPAFSWFEAEDLDNILEAIDFANESSKPLAIIGKGTNILVKDAGFKGVIIRLGAGFDYIEREDHNVLKVGASSAISKLVAKSVKWGLSGCEFLTGIPGSFGGSV
ncbi:MAG: FAD-binding protein, partial [Candidatus Omnitrophota bacterium]|nr:FAD-binding protein [Candidatus Omnitrophota bacterium]